MTPLASPPPATIPPLNTDAVARGWAEYWITLRRTADGVERECHEAPFPGTVHGVDPDGYGRWHWATVFWWLEGNGSCDCNRELTFRRAVAEVVRPEDVACSDGRYEIVSVRFPDGTVLPWTAVVARQGLEETLVHDDARYKL